MKKIESRENKVIKRIKSLKQKKNRDKENVFIAEGLRFVNHIPQNFEIELYLISEKFLKENTISEYEKRSIVYLVEDKIFQNISDTEHPQGILAVCKRNEKSLTEILNSKNNQQEESNAFYIVLEALQDPANVGTILRTADACGVDAVFLTKGCVDIYNPKLLRGTMGSMFNLSIVHDLELSEIMKELKSRNITTYAMHLSGTEYPYTMNLKENCCFLVGNEANGLTDECSNICDKFVKLPMIGNAESLNASIACGVMLYEVVRQRINN